MAWCLALPLIALLCAPGCGESQRSEPTGGETHFLTRCQPGAGACGDELSCVCGVCTLPCQARAACQEFPDAACIGASDAAACSGYVPIPHCDVPCVVDGDCASLSALHRCEGGACRAPSLTPGSGGSGGGSAGSTSTGAEAGAAGSCQSGQVSSNQVLVIGDSFFALSHQITAFLEGRERARGVLSSGDRYRDNSNLISNGLALNGNGIADQYARGAAESPVAVVIMNGGGADILPSNCGSDSSCATYTAAAAALDQLLAQMASDGVSAIIYVGYPDPLDPAVRTRVDALRPLLESSCQASKAPCHFLDLRPVFAGHDADYVLGDGMNPTAAGAQAAADAIGELMETACIAQ